MRLKLVGAACALVVAGLAAMPAQAAVRVGVAVGAPVVVAPAPVYPPPVVYAPPVYGPVLVAPPPVVAAPYGVVAVGPRWHGGWHHWHH